MMTTLGDMSIGELIGYLHHAYGRDGVKQTFDVLLTQRSSYFCYETIEPAIRELREVGLLIAARDLEDLIKDLPHRWELACPELPPHDRSWREGMAKEKEAWEGKHGIPSTGS